MNIDCIADLHGYYPDMPGGDLLIVAGDLTARDTPPEYLKFLSWMHKQNYEHYIFIAGNHDNMIEKGEMITEGLGNTTYLCDSGMEFEMVEPEEEEITKWGTKMIARPRKIKVWGSPWTLTFPGMNPKCKAFTVDTEEELSKKWELIPPDTEILITHSPSFGNFDYTDRGESVGSLTLWMKLLTFLPKVHICGHIHEAYGQSVHHNGIKIINCSHVNERYQPVNKPVRIIL